jgi:hypothetical protein
MAKTMHPTESNVEKLAFTAREVCQSISISSTTLWRLEKRNILKPLPGIGRHKLYNAAAVRRLAETGAA